MFTRMSRLNEKERDKAKKLGQLLATSSEEDKPDLFRQFADLLFSADAFSPLTDNLEILAYQPELHGHVWRDAAALRSGPGHVIWLMHS